MLKKLRKYPIISVVLVVAVLGGVASASVGRGAILSVSGLASGETVSASKTAVATSRAGFNEENPVPSNFDTNKYITKGGPIPASSAWEPTGNFRFICEFSHIAFNDPVVFPGQPGAAHLHMFFGNKTVDAFSTYTSLRTTGDSTCQGGPINRSAYWAPAAINTSGKVVVPDYAAVYYKGTFGGTPAIESIPHLPAGLRMIAGYDMANPSTATDFAWYCENGGAKTQTIPNCPAGVRVGVVVAFPACWNGRDLDSADHRSHMAYQTYGNNGKAVCPASHSVHLPEFTIGFWFTHDGNAKNWYLSSDRMAGMTHANGTTFHSDWLGAWDPAVLQRWVDSCINGLLNCKGGELGDGTSLSGSVDYTGPRILDIPANQ